LCNVHCWNATQYYSTETVLLIFPFLRTNITVQMRPSGVRGYFLVQHEQWLTWRMLVRGMSSNAAAGTPGWAMAGIATAAGVTAGAAAVGGTNDSTSLLVIRSPGPVPFTIYMYKRTSRNKGHTKIQVLQYSITEKYIVNHKKRATLFLIITLAFLGRFLYFLYQWKQEGILCKIVNKIYHFTLTVSPHYLANLKPRIFSTF